MPRSDAPRRHHLDLPWGRLCYWVTGIGPPVLALHGLGGSGRYWDRLAGRLAAHRMVVAPDLGGFGHSSKPDSTYDRDFHLGTIDALVGHLTGEGQPLTVVGHSLGGALAGLWMARRPHRVGAAALVAAPFPGGSAMPAASRRIHDRDRRPRRRHAYAVLQAVWPVLTLPVRSRIFPRPVIAEYMRHTLQSYWGTATSILWDPSAQAELGGLSGITAPVLLLTGAADRNVAPADADRWAAALARAERAVLPGGHQLLFRGGDEVLAGWILHHGPNQGRSPRHASAQALHTPVHRIM